MEGMNKQDRSGLLPPPPPPLQPARSRVTPSTPAFPLKSSQLGTQHQLTVHNGGGGNKQFLEGWSHSCINIPHYQSPISGGGGSEISSRTESMTLPAADATRDFNPQPDPNSEDRRLRRLLSNRISAQRSRLRRTNYINEMETHVKEFEAQIAQLTPEVILTQRKKKIIQMDNEVMKQKKMSLQERINLKNAETEAYQTELNHLRQLFELQKQGWMATAAWAPGHEDCTTNQCMYQQGSRQLAQNLYHQPWPQPQQQFANPNMRRHPSAGLEQMENLGISMTDHHHHLDQSHKPAAAGKEGMGNPGKY